MKKNTIVSLADANYFPLLEELINLAILPSNPSMSAANIIAIIANSNLPSNANLIDVNPIQTPIKVNMFGKITLAVFLSVTILKFFFCGSITF